MELPKIKSGLYKGAHVARYMQLGGRRRRIDTNLYDLIDGLNRLGIVTQNSCGGSCMGWCKRKHRILKKTWVIDHGKRVQCTHYSKPKLCRESFTITFQDTSTAAKFMNLVYRESDPEKLRDHMQGGGRKQSHAWTWSHRLEDFNDRRVWYSNRVRGKKISPPNFDFWSIVVIPHAHLELVTQRVLERCKRLRK